MDYRTVAAIRGISLKRYVIMKLKPLGGQVIVLTGATSGIGLATARMAAQYGARGLLYALSRTRMADDSRLNKKELNQGDSALPNSYMHPG